MSSQHSIALLQEVGVFQKKSEAKGVQEQLMTNPDMMQNMMKQQLTGLVPQVTCHAQSLTQHAFIPPQSHAAFVCMPAVLLQCVYLRACCHTTPVHMSSHNISTRPHIFFAAHRG